MGSTDSTWRADREAIWRVIRWWELEAWWKSEEIMGVTSRYRLCICLTYCMSNSFIMCVYSGMAVPPATKPDSPSCIATPKPPSLTGAEFSFEANSTQWGCRGRKKDASNSEWKNKLYRRLMVHIFQLVKWGTVLVSLKLYSHIQLYKPQNQLTNKCDNALFFLLTKI